VDIAEVHRQVSDVSFNDFIAAPMIITRRGLQGICKEGCVCGKLVSRFFSEV